jgi:hypothetical protein
MADLSDALRAPSCAEPPERDRPGGSIGEGGPKGWSASRAASWRPWAASASGSDSGPSRHTSLEDRSQICPMVRAATPGSPATWAMVMSRHRFP